MSPLGPWPTRRRDKFLCRSKRTQSVATTICSKILGRIMDKRRDDITAYFDHPGTSNGPSEAINGLLEHLCSAARGFRNLIDYIVKCLLDAGGFRPLIHSLL